VAAARAAFTAATRPIAARSRSTCARMILGARFVVMARSIGPTRSGMRRSTGFVMRDGASRIVMTTARAARSRRAGALVMIAVTTMACHVGHEAGVRGLGAGRDRSLLGIGQLHAALANASLVQALEQVFDARGRVLGRVLLHAVVHFATGARALHAAVVIVMTTGAALSCSTQVLARVFLCGLGLLLTGCRLVVASFDLGRIAGRRGRARVLCIFASLQVAGE